MSIARQAWARRADALAAETWRNLVTRTDAFGEFLGDRWTTRKEPLTESVLKQHYLGERTIGIFTVSQTARTRTVIFDIDSHGDGFPDADSAAVRRLLRSRGLSFLEEDSDGRGGRHYWVMFEDWLDTGRLLGLIDHWRRSYRFDCEVFPKGVPCEAKPYGGGFIRLPGLHPKHQIWSRFLEDDRMLGDSESVERWLNQPLNPVLPGALPSEGASASFSLEEGGGGQSTQKSTQDPPPVFGSLQSSSVSLPSSSVSRQSSSVSLPSSSVSRQYSSVSRQCSSVSPLSSSVSSTIEASTDPSEPSQEEAGIRRDLSADQALHADLVRGLDGPARLDPATGESESSTAGPDDRPPWGGPRGHRSLENRIQDAIHDSIPNKPRNRQRSLWKLARRLAAIPELRDAPLSEHRPWIKAWHGEATPFIETKDFEESWADYCRMSPRVRVPLDPEFVNRVAAEIPWELIVVTYPEYSSKTTLGLLSLCAGLDRFCAPDGVFFLSCRVAEAALGVGYKTAADHLNMLVVDGILELVTKGSQESGASRYRLLRPVSAKASMTSSDDALKETGNGESVES